MNKKYYIDYRSHSIIPSLFFDKDIILLKKHIKRNNNCVYLIEGTMIGYSLDVLLNKYNHYLKNLNYNNLNYEIAIELINEYKSILRNEKIKTLIYE